MDMFLREIQLLERHSAREAAVLIRLAAGKTISETARDLQMSRSTVYHLLREPEFKRAVIEEQRHLIAVGVIEDRCLRYRQKVLRAVIRTFAKMEGAEARLSQFKKKLDHIDRLSKMDELP